LRTLAGMDLKVFAPHELTLVARALRGIAGADGTVTAAEEAMIDGLARLHGHALDADALDPISPAALAAQLTDAHRRKRAVQLAIVTALVDEEPSEERARAVRDFAEALDIRDEGLRVLYRFTHGHRLLARFDMVRRLSRFMRARKDFPGMLAFLRPTLGLSGPDPELAAPYLALRDCAPGTFGRALFDHYEENHFAFPGQPNGIPAIGVFHDVGHVLSGYGTDPQGEIQQAAFQAGFSRNDGFTFLLFGILQFHLGVRLTPIAQAQHGLFDVARVLRAAERGAACRVDLGDFDLFAHANVPLEALREQLGVPPLEERRAVA
jgi:hypothetical protein